MVTLNLGDVGANLGGTLAGLALLINACVAAGGWRQGLKNADAAAKIQATSTANAEKLEVIHTATNGLTAALVAKTRDEALLEGRTHEQSAQSQREAQTAILVGVMADPASTSAQKADAAAVASRPV
jgi:hypothetical protein